MNLVLRNDLPFPSRFRSSAFDEPFDRLVNSMFEDFFSPALRQESSISTPRINVVENENAYEVEAELPGVSKEDVKISIDSQRISIEAETEGRTERKEGENVVYAERSIRKFARSFTLPSEVDDTQAGAKLENGVLHLTLPKKQATRAKQIAIQ